MLLRMTTQRNPLPRPTGGTVLHRQVFLVLRSEIARGMYPSGALPNEETLCERFGVSRITIRRALSDLAAQRIVERRHGLGTFVLANPASARPAPSLQLIDNVRQAVKESKVQVIEIGAAPPPADVARLLRLAGDGSAFHAQRLRINRDAEPAVLSDAWVPLAIGRATTKAALKNQPIYDILTAQGIKLGRVVQEISATTVSDPRQAQLLKAEVGSPLLKVVRLVHDLDEQPLLYLAVHAPADRATILMEVAGEDIDTLSAGQIMIDPPAGGTSF